MSSAGVQNEPELVAAAKLSGQMAAALLFGLLASAPARAQDAPNRRFEITDNSFLVEEAFNQEAGIFQNIFGVMRVGSEWEGGFTQEWPVRSMRHQLSYTVPFLGGGAASGIGDVLINYRFQVSEESTGLPAVAPRLSVVLPTGRESDGLGDGVVGLQVNLPISKQRGDIYWHLNGGFTWLPGVNSGAHETVGDVTLLTPHIAASTIWRVRPMLNLMLEHVLEVEERVTTPGTTARDTRYTLSPGVRGGWNLGEHQLILGLALPIVFSEEEHRLGAFVYFSYELPFTRSATQP